MPRAVQSVADPVLKGWANGFGGLGAELGQFVVEKHAPVGQRDQARSRNAPSSDQSPVRYRVVRGEEGPVVDKGLTLGEHVCHHHE